MHPASVLPLPSIFRQRSLPYAANSTQLNSTQSINQSIILPHRTSLIRFPLRVEPHTPLIHGLPDVRVHLPRPTFGLGLGRTGASQPPLRRRPREREIILPVPIPVAGLGTGAVREPARVRERDDVCFVRGRVGEGAVFGDVDGLAAGDIGVLCAMPCHGLGVSEVQKVAVLDSDPFGWMDSSYQFGAPVTRHYECRFGSDGTVRVGVCGAGGSGRFAEPEVAVAGVQAGEVDRRARLKSSDDEGTCCRRLTGEKRDSGSDGGNQCEDKYWKHIHVDL